MKIGLNGLAFRDGNKGCGALAYSFLKVLNEYAEENETDIDIVVIGNASTKTALPFVGNKWAPLPEIDYNRLNYYIAPIENKKLFKLARNSIKKCDVVFDFTAGDSFSDIYGIDRLRKDCRIKSIIMDLGVPLVLGSQTYGPFYSEEAKSLARSIFERCNFIFARDEMSLQKVSEFGRADAFLTTDIAFLLPYKKSVQQIDEVVHVGFNPSGLLWNGGYTGDNQFSLSLDYRRYCIDIIRNISSDSKYCVHLIPHVHTENEKWNSDNDLVPCRELKKQFPNINVAPAINLPSDLKTYISKMDVFIGARMHSTIAAFSANVPTIPFSYSRKFEGLYESLGYDYLIHGTMTSNEEAIMDTLNFIDKRKELSDAMVNPRERISEMLDSFKLKVFDIIDEMR